MRKGRSVAGRKKRTARILAAVFAAAVLSAGTAFGAVTQVGPGVPKAKEAFQAKEFALPEEARVLVVVEGTGGSDCKVYAYEKADESCGLRRRGSWERTA